MTTDQTWYDLKQLVDMDIYETLDKSIIDDALSKPPFVPIPGIINIRDLGAVASSHLRRGLIYRSGALNKLPASSTALLKDEFGIKCILDLRTGREQSHSPDPNIEGMTSLHCDTLKAPTPVDLNDFIEEGGKTGYVKMYGEVLEIHRPGITKGLQWVRDGKGPILFHCTAGKDRTGVLAAVILALTGAPKDIIAYDFALTRIGIEPNRELLLQMLKLWNKDWIGNTPGMKEFSQVKGEFILGMLEMMEEDYGGVEGYVKSLGFGDEDIEKMRAVLKGK